MRKFKFLSSSAALNPAHSGSNHSHPVQALWTWALLALIACALLSTPNLSAQAISTGTVVGTVTDPSNAIIPDAEITITDKSTNATRKSVTNAEGRFVFANVTPGDYDVRITKQGFKTATVMNQAVEIGKTLTENVSMQVGQLEQTVTVETTGTELQTMNATTGDTVNGIALESLPSLGRDVSTFIVMQPGVSPDGSVAGTVVDQSSFQLDGGQNTNDMDGSMSVYTPSYAGSPAGGGIANQSPGLAAGPTGVLPTPADGIDEFKVNTSNQTADFNSSSGAQVQMLTKHGTNSFHGSVYEYYFDNKWNANTWDNNHTNPKTPLPDYHYSRFGASLGGPLLPFNVLGGKTYFFGLYQGFRWPNSTTIERAVPSASMRLGLLSFNGTVYNLNPTPVTYNGTTYAPSGLDPRNLGLNPLISQLWNKYMPLPNESPTQCTLSRCDNDPVTGLSNVGGFRANVGIPQNDNFGVLRLDHDFGDKWRFNGTYHYYRLERATTSQVDIGGLLPGDKLGVPKAVSSRPQVPWLYTVGLTTQVTSTVTNDFHYSFLRNWWSWQDPGDVPQFSALGGALEPGGESATQALLPYNVNTQQTRTRYWDGLDHYFRDDVSWLRGNHFMQFGGIYQHNFNKHQRTDNGGGINYQPVYQIGTGSGAGIGGVPVPPGVTATRNFGRDYSEILGIVSIAQQAFTRSGNNLQLNPPLTPAFDQSTVPYYNVYASDSWHMKPSFTLTYGLGWTLEMPPVEKNGKQVEFVDANNRPIAVTDYLKARQQAALAGQVYNPIVGFDLIGNVAGHPKYPYNPFYGEFSPRIAAAWNPHFDKDGLLGKITGGDRTVVRGGYGRIFGRLNGVDLVLVPLLGTGLIQPVQCVRPTRTGVCGGATPSTAFRIGVDGNTAPLPAAAPTLPQPYFPGIGGNAEAGAGEALDPHFRPNQVDSFTLSLQRQLSSRVTMELGYIGRIIRNEYQPINVNAVPHMFTLGGQRFSSAYAALEKATQFGNNIPATVVQNGLKTIPGIQAQPFFEAALAGTGYCNGYVNCTTAVLDQESSNFAVQDVWHLWSDLDNGGKAPGFNFAPTMLNSAGQLSSGVGVNASIGYGNYNAGYASIHMNSWHGITMQQNFTWSKALGTGAMVQATSEYTADDPFNLHTMYGLQAFDRKYVYNAFLVYEPPFFKNQQGLLGRILGGWNFAPLFSAGSGLPEESYTINGGGAAFGEGDSINFFSNENAVVTTNKGISPSRHNNVTGTVAGTAGNINIFANPDQVFNSLRQPILGLDGNDGGFGILRGLPYWNLDLSVRKTVRVAERFGLEGQVIFTNVLNHMQFTDPSFDTSNPSQFGVLNSQGNSPRQMEFGIRVKF